MRLSRGNNRETLYNKIENFSKLLSFSSCEHMTKSSRVPYLLDSEKPCAPLVSATREVSGELCTVVVFQTLSEAPY